MSKFFSEGKQLIQGGNLNGYSLDTLSSETDIKHLITLPRLLDCLSIIKDEKQGVYQGKDNAFIITDLVTINKIGFFDLVDDDGNVIFKDKKGAALNDRLINAHFNAGMLNILVDIGTGEGVLAIHKDYILNGALFIDYTTNTELISNLGIAK